MLESIARVTVHKIIQSGCKAINSMKIVIEKVKNQLSRQ